MNRSARTSSTYIRSATTRSRIPIADGAVLRSRSQVNQGRTVSGRGAGIGRCQQAFTPKLPRHPSLENREMSRFTQQQGQAANNRIRSRSMLVPPESRRECMNEPYMLMSADHTTTARVSTATMMNRPRSVRLRKTENRVPEPHLFCADRLHYQLHEFSWRLRAHRYLMAFGPLSGIGQSQCCSRM